MPLVVGGTSAGAMVLSTPMIYAGNEDVKQLGGEIKVTTGLEFLKDVCVDTHFVHRGRFIRRAQVVGTKPTCIGTGIKEDTALIIRHGPEAEMTGSGRLIIIKGFDITESSMRDFSKKRPVSIRDLRVDIFSSGNTFAIPQMNPPHV